MKILLIDDHSLFREGLELLLQRLDPRMQVVHAATLEAGLAHLQATSPPDLVCTDLNLPGVSGLTALVRVHEVAPDVPVVVLAGGEDPAVVRQAIEQGALGYIPKSHDSVDLSKALAQVLQGGVYLPALALASEYQEEQQPNFTPRQREVLLRLVQGKSNKTIARELGISDTTVKTHVAVVLQVLGVHSRAQAVYAVARMGLRLAELPAVA
ncbi:response regulator [Ideonella livida]|uniref:Response regulator transcription factor n=1 Tax=Ideonella livida TaxID=2707176 RepID=A0A7C9PKI7_9BURK|nr:response regulator transcription factor [Ideonella livida]NDY93332.1 response regulator transcription factor [Ideonella livida]